MDRSEAYVPSLKISIINKPINKTLAICSHSYSIGHLFSATDVGEGFKGIGVPPWF